jgi:regulator of sirC expression with transglutaminase-like and TPR domain
MNATNGDIEAALREVGAREDSGIDLAEAALLLAAADNPGAELAPYRQHLADIEAAMAEAAPMQAALEACCQTLAEVMAAGFGYRGDRATYDDLDNANLMRVIDRRKGLPVALAILYIHAARSRNWRIEGVNLPGHFVLRLFHDGRAIIIDPFAEGEILDSGALRRRLKAAVGEQAELQPSHYAAIGNRDILLRLENNIKLRLIQQGAAAAGIVQRMLMVAPAQPGLWRESGLLNTRLGNLLHARSALMRFLELAETDTQRQQAARLLQEIKDKLQ